MAFVESFYGMYVRASRPLSAAGDYFVENVLPECIKSLRESGKIRPLLSQGEYYNAARARKSGPWTDSEGRLSEWYRYEPLQARQIRLFRLRPGLETDPVSCSLTAYHLDDHPDYEALSYTWGDATELHTIRCDGKSIQVTHNLFRALGRLRYADRDRLIWIDAVCINQGDIAEQGAQVRLMSDIYKRASSVVVWLGDSTQDSSAAFRFMRRLSTLVDSMRPEDKYSRISEKEIEVFGLPNSGSPEWTGVEAMYWKPWFTRVWIIQEIALARSAIVQCGEDSIPWRDFVSAAQIIHHRRLGAIDVTTVLPLYDVAALMQKRGPQDLIHLLVRFRRSFATKPVDKVYALLGLTSEELIIPDYTTPVGDVYREIARTFLLRSLDVLSLICDRSWNMIDDLSSWVPDWSAFLREYPYLFYGSRDLFHACGDTSPVVGFSPDGKTLSLRGVLLDHVGVTGGPYVTSKVDPNKSFTGTVGKGMVEETMKLMLTRSLRAWEQIVLDLKRYPTGEDIESVLHRTLVAGANITVEDAPYVSMAELYANFRRHYLLFLGESMDPGRLPGETGKAAAANFRRSVDSATHGRRLFTTKGGYVGIGPNSTRSGDCVVLFCGGSTAYVLRKDSKGPTYKFLGESYVHGFMNGEGFAGEPAMQDFDMI
ncbi:hypothetical protein AAE478_003864 [Parahypoxylon ruwenzoriense]